MDFATTMYDVAEIELVYRSKVKASERVKITSSRDVFQVLKRLWQEETVELREEFKVLFLNRANRVLGAYHLSSGGVCGTVVDPKLVFAAALRANACGVIVAHNHPSGNLQPSQADIDLTRKLKEAGRVLEIQLLDHLIYTVEGYYSMADEGLL